VLLARARTMAIQTHPSAESHTLLEYQCNEPRVFGIELRPAGPSDLKGVLSSLLWLGRSKAFSNELTFVVMSLPNRTDLAELRQIAQCASEQGLADKLCLVASSDDRCLPATIMNVQRCGLRVLLGGVGATSRFCDVTDHPIDGIVVEPQLIMNATGDPRAASILDAVVALAANLGVKSFANECSSQTEFDLATSTGISYVTYAHPYVGDRGNADSATVRVSGMSKQSITRR